MASKKKQPSPSKSTKHPSMLAPPVPPRPLLAALRLPKKSPPKSDPKSPPKQLLPTPKYLRVPPNGFYISNSCDNVHKLSRQPYLNEVYGNSHILLGQHVHNHSHEGAKKGLFLRSSPSMKLPHKPFVGSHPDIASYPYARGLWGPEKYDYVDRRFLKESVDRKALREYVDRKTLKENYVDHKAIRSKERPNCNGYDYYDRCYDGYNSSYSSSYSSGYSSYHHKTAPVPCYPVRKVYSTNSSSSSKSSCKSKSSSYSYEQNATFTRYTFNQCTFRTDAEKDRTAARSDKERTLNSDKERVNSVPRKLSYSRNPDYISGSDLAISQNSDPRHSSKSDYSPVSDFSKQFPLSAKMTSLHGLPPLPKSLSGVNLQAAAEMNGGVDRNGVERNGLERNGGAHSGGPERKGRTLPTPPASLSQNNVTPVNYVAAANRKPVSLDAKLTILRQEMYGLRQLDLSLLSQLWSLNESIQEFRQLQESISVPSPSDDGEDTDEMLYSNMRPVSGRRYRKISRNGDDSSSSSSSVDFGKV